MEWLRHQDCAAMWDCSGDVVAHHVRLGQNGGTGIKPSDYRCLPLCDKHHKELHQHGEATFFAKHNHETPEQAMAEFMEMYAEERNVDVFGAQVLGMEMFLNGEGL